MQEAALRLPVHDLSNGRDHKLWLCVYVVPVQVPEEGVA